MKGDFSRLTFDKTKHYSAVMMQQGRVQVDADWNEQQAIHRYSMETQARDVIGICGAPKEGGGFKIDVSSNGTDLIISPGRIYVEGILCEADGQFTYTTQPDFPNPDKLDFKNGNYLVYLDVWHRHITALNDPLLREKALGGPDTTTRLKTLWQVKVFALPSASGWKALWKARTAADTVKMNARTQAKSGYRQLENQLYRIEIHQPGLLGAATFKWSRDNGSVVTAIERFDGVNVIVSDTGKDEVMGFAPGQWAELIDDLKELRGEAGQLVRIKEVDPATRIITLNTAPATVDKKWHPKLRRWENAGELKVEVPAVNDGWISIDDGNLEVRFDKGYYKTGDYWLIPARTATGEIEWPPYEIPNSNPIPQPPLGIQHHHYPLAILSLEGGKRHVEDLRELFPSLTKITASDVRLNKDNSLCELSGVETVQEAIDLLCQKPNECCTYNIAPGQGWESLFERLVDGQDIHICFQVGTYSLENTITLRNKGNVKISGCGAGTRIVASAEAVLKFEDCKSVIIRDIYTESLLTSTVKKTGDHLNGAITFLNCNSVMVEGVTANCAAGVAGAATGITVRNTASVRICHCELGIGHQQVGILVVNAKRAQVEDNVLRVTEGSRDLKSKLAENREYLAALRKQLVSNVYLDKEVPTGGRTNTEVKFGDHRIFFKTSKQLADKWQQLVDSNPPTKINNSLDLVAYVKNMANRILLNEGSIKTESAIEFKKWYELIESQNPAVASQGIVCGGQMAGEVRIINNTIDGFLQGVHIGVSHREKQRGVPDMADKVYVTGNVIVVKLPVQVLRERHGIFVGNCKSLFVENNHVKVERLGSGNSRRIEGIRIFGHLGRLAIVRQNYLEDCTVGIFAQPLNKIKEENKTEYYQWLVADNVAINAKQAVTVPPGIVRKYENYK